MTDIVESTKKPPVSAHDDRRDGAVVDSDKRERPGSGSDREGHADGTPVRERRYPPARMSGSNPFDSSADPLGQLFVALSSRHYVPALALHHLYGHGVERDDLVTVEPAFPISEPYLAEAWFDERCELELPREGRSGLVGAAQRRHVDGVDLPALQAIGDSFGLCQPVWAELRVAVPVDERERLCGIGGNRLAVPDKDDLSRERRRRETHLSMPPNRRLRHSVTHPARLVGSTWRSRIHRRRRPDDRQRDAPEPAAQGARWRYSASSVDISEMGDVWTELCAYGTAVEAVKR